VREASDFQWAFDLIEELRRDGVEGEDSSGQ
jgi:hypothetical protein